MHNCTMVNYCSQIVANIQPRICMHIDIEYYIPISILCQCKTLNETILAFPLINP